MNDLFWYYTTTLVFVGCMSVFYAFYRNVVANKYIESEKRLRLKLNEANSYFKGDSQKVPEFMQNAIGDIGIDSILNELGLGMFAPIAKGFLSNPDNIKKILPMLEKAGIKLPVGGNNEDGKTPPSFM